MSLYDMNSVKTQGAGRRAAMGGFIDVDGRRAGAG
jgi:hypothetical protein